MKKQLLFTFLFLTITKLTFATFTQGNWRWRNDDGNETTATWAGAENTAIQLNTQNDVLRLRTEIGVPISSYGGATGGFNYQYSLDGTTFTALSTTSGSNDFVIASTNSNVINGTATTKQLAGYSDFSAYNYAPGQVIVDQSSGSYTTSSSNNLVYEHELVILPTQNMQAGKTYYFRIDGGAGYPVTLPSITTASTLPISFKSLTAKPLQNGVIVSWKTTSELNNKYFDLQRSTDGLTWEVIAKIDGSGTTNKEINYSFLDRNPIKGLSYYRLAQYDFDGKSTISGVVSTKFEIVNEGVSVYPNPFTDKLTVSLNGYSGKVFNVSLYNIQGKLISSKKIVAENSELKFDLDNIQPSGIYSLHVIGNNLNFSKKVSVK